MVSTIVSIPGYRISEELYNGSRTLVYRGYREADSLPVVIKLLKTDYPSFSELVQFRNQYTIAKNLNSPLIIETYSLEPYQNGYALVMEDFGGVSLKEWGVRGSVESLIEFLRIAIALSNTLDILYRSRIIHKDIKPANILINPKTKQVKLIDFSIASLLPRETQTLLNPNVLEGTLAYISPEQTGRMNRQIDYRTDFYSVGVTFYQLLTGKLPFQSEDAMELVHCHLAKTATLVHEINSEIPSVLSAIVSKLMAKNSEDRYQSALGLKYDLENCLIQLQETGTIENFPIAQRDLCDRFVIPDKIYGRETEVKTLLQAFDRVSLGATEIMLVAGFSGIGKTVVVNEVHKPIVRQRGYFIKGKYDQFGRNIPFSAFVQAFRDLMEQLLTESDIQIQQWKTKILEAVGENGQVIIEVIPELSRIVGEQPPAIELSGTAAENRFNLLFKKFTQVFTSASHPLVIFLDDLQWADLASLKLMQLLMTDTSHLFIICAYRDNEVNPTHPLILTLNEIAKSQATINTITLAPLSQGQVNKLIADTLKCSEDLAWHLSVLIYQKTKGNPFFATQFLKALHQDGLINFDVELGCWQCNLSQVTAQAVTDDVVTFMSLQLQKLPRSTQNVLQLAACIGNSFDLSTLAIVSQQSEIETAAALWKALQEGLILPIGDVYKFYVGQENQARTSQNQLIVTYKFLHDRVQQAAYSLIPDDQKQTTHYQIGKLLLQQISAQATEDRIFEIVNQLNHGTALITQPTQREELARLNLIACRKAKSSTAYQAAREYTDVGLSLLGQAWQQHYEMTLAFHELAAEVAMLGGDFETMEQFINIVIEQAHDLLEKVNVYRIRIQAKVSQMQFTQVLGIGINLLQQLGITITESPTMADIQQSIQEISEFIGDQKVEDFANLPVMTDAKKIAITQIASSIMATAYSCGSLLYPLLTTLVVKLSLQHGNISVSATNYACYSLVLCNIQKDIDLAAQFGQLALHLASKFDDKAPKPEVFLLLGGYILHRNYHIAETLPLLKEGYTLGLEIGNLEYAGYCAQTFCRNAFYCGQPLAELEQNTRNYYHALVQLKQLGSANSCAIYWQAILNLLGFAEHPTIFSSSALQEAEFLPLLRSANDWHNLCMFYLYKLTLCFLFGEFEAANNLVLECRNYFMGGASTVGEPAFYFYDSLIALAQLTQRSGEVSTALERVAENQTLLQHWAHYAPMNYQHKVDLVAAEKCRVLGQKTEAIELYDLAISLAKANEYIQDEALANELAAKFYLDWGKQRIAGEYMIEAYYGYARWGAKAKVANLEKRYPQLLAPVLQQTRSALSTHETIFAVGTVTSTSATSSTNVSYTLDLKAILKASHTISSEIELEKLLSSLLRIVIENAGADKCVLMLLRDDRLLIKGSMSQGTQPVVLQRTPVEDSQDIPHKLIYKVKHSNQTVVLMDATADPILANDPYIVRQQPKSILCSPILHQGKLMGILYLENSLAKGAFTSDRVELLNLLCAQAAISLENARLYERSQQYAQQLERSFEALENALNDLQQAQIQIVQSEKMSALGNLVAGVAHEINNPVGCIIGNVGAVQNSINDLFALIDLYNDKFPQPGTEIEEELETIDLEYLRDDLPKLIRAMKDGGDRIKSISKSLRTFSRADSDQKQLFNLHEGIDSTILILRHRLKANETRPAIEVVTNYGNIPATNCFPGQLNQVFMNILANAIDALDESNNGRSFAEVKANSNRITIQTSVENDRVKIAIIDNGKGMSEEVKQKIFDHLFTTKSVGKGTGLGLAIARQIVEETHGGKLSCNSVLGEGTEFIIEIPV
ncbi:serine/threonine protein kinase with two-component sensor domain [Nostoc commune NIES-4072]|uniref:histidine kinase n=1 Tax=Nostoc commune NIES-4072 TaxID=2005467 RepID=A0A2R5FSM2_NOSCO|nr:ATP-binding sensor histidine kinase [Nostoc commune]BBD67252.1 serine/threonine protein kinase with two-component sensor domain [Nostoc commune HK-02]GBG21766.1 serine/threonine protein kinase with two-component sensor domain [Nostoc commune NIES-4072]